FGPSTQAILDEAARRDIPYIRLNDQSFVQLGQGKYQQRIRATMTSRTSALGVDIAGDKKLTTSLLASAGLPVPKSETVRWAAEGAPAHVMGPGEPTVRELVDLTNRDPRRGSGHEKVLTRIKIDADAEELLKRQGFGLEQIPPRDAVVKLAATANMSTGGISIDRTMEADHDNVEIAEEAARVVGLDVAGIDFLTPDICQPVRETGGAIVEVNAAPGFRMHTHPTEGEPQYVAKAVIDLLFPQ